MNKDSLKDESNCCNCCSDCLTSDCLLPWRSKSKGGIIPTTTAVETDHLEHVDYHFRGRVDSSCSLTGAPLAAPIPTEIVTQQPTVAALDVSDTKSSSLGHKKSVTSLDTAILASSAGILSQVMHEGSSNNRSGTSSVSDCAQIQLSLSWEEAYSTLVIFYSGLRHYHSVCMPQSSPTPTTGSTESSPLVLAGGNSAGSALMLRLCLQGSTDQAGGAATSTMSAYQQVCFSSIQTRSKNTAWKENISLEANAKRQNDQNILVVLYETNKFSKWTPVKVGSHTCAGLLIPGTQNLTLDLHNITEDVHPFGQIKLSICYNKSSSRVYLDILEGRSLFHWALTKKGEYFVKVQFFDLKKITKMKKTGAVKPDATSLLQIFETIRAKVPLASLNNLSIKVMICDAKVIMSDSCLYYVVFGQDNSTGAAEATYWADFLREVPASGQKQWFSLHQK